MAMSKMQLYRKIAALTDQTVYNYIRTIRLNKAAAALLTTDMQIAEVALQVGFTEPSNFTRCFNRQFNQTPSQFIKTHSKEYCEDLSQDFSYNKLVKSHWNLMFFWFD